MPWFNKSAPNYATTSENQVEDTFISEMMAEFGRFNQDFFIMKILSKSIDVLGTDPQRFILLVDILEMSLLNSGRVNENYSKQIKEKLIEFETIEGKTPNDLEGKLNYQLKKAGIKFSVIFGQLSSTQPVEIVGVLDPVGYNELMAEKEKVKKAKKEAEKNE